MFRVGQKVCCVDDRSNNWSSQWIVRGGIYTISSVGRLPPLSPRFFKTSNYLVIELEGIDKPNGFASLRFRPLTDISFAHEILRKVSRKQEIGA